MSRKAGQKANTSSIFDRVQVRNGWVGASGPAELIHVARVTDVILAAGCEHIACYLAIRYGLGLANAGHVSIQKLAKVTHLSRERCTEIIADMRDIITRCGGLA